MKHLWTVIGGLVAIGCCFAPAIAQMVTGNRAASGTHREFDPPEGLAGVYDERAPDGPTAGERETPSTMPACEGAEGHAAESGDRQARGAGAEAAPGEGCSGREAGTLRASATPPAGR